MSAPTRSRPDRLDWQELPAGDFWPPGAWCVGLAGTGPTRAAGRPIGIRKDLWLTLAETRPDGSRGLLHVRLRDDGALREVLAEEQGDIGLLFEGPRHQPWAVLRDTSNGRTQELVAPLQDRDSWLLEAPSRAFGDEVFGRGERVGRVDVDSREGHPDRWQVMSLREDGVRHEPKVKLPPPQGHHVLWDGNELHAWASDGAGNLVVRELSQRGSVLRERVVALGHHVLSPARLSFEGPSVVLAGEGRELRWLEVGPGGTVVERGGITLPRRREALELGRAQTLADGAVVLRYDTVSGDGWCVMRDGEVVEHFTRVEADGYAELISGRTLELPRAGWAAVSITPHSRGYAVVLAPDAQGPAGDVRGVVVFGRAQPGAED